MKMCYLLRQSRFPYLPKVAEQMRTLWVEVLDVQGNCPVYEVGDGFRIEEGYQLVSEQSVCMHALQSIAPYYVALSRGISATELGLADPDGDACVQCLDPLSYTGGGTVTLKIVAKEDGLED
jgi:uncharacterized repeat protein (TIGR04076 family)